MRHNPSRGSASPHQFKAGTVPHTEAPLDRYLVEDSPVKQFVAERLHQAPWWTISFLVHAVALLVAWRFPYQPAVNEASIEPPPYRIVNIDLPPLTPPPVRPLPPPPDLPDDYKIDRDAVANLTPPNPPEIVTPPELPKEVKVGDPLDHDTVQQIMPFAVFDPKWRPLRPRSPYGLRDDLRKRIDGDPDGTGLVPFPPGGGVGTIVAALLWLQQAQESDGSWDAKSWEGSQEYRVGMTGLALLAYQGAGFTHVRGKRFTSTIGRALEWLARAQRSDGSFPFETFYEQGIAGMAVAEAFGMTRDPKVKHLAQRAIDYIVGVQPEHGGFRYNGAVPQGEGDMSVTGWQIMAIKSAITAGLDVPPRAVERSQVFLKNAARDYGASAYLVRDDKPGSLAITAIGMLCRVFLSEEASYENEIRQAAYYLLGKETVELTPVPGGASKQLVNDLYYTYYSSLAMFQQGDEFWRTWQAMYYKPLVDAQEHGKLNAQGRFVKGSWDPKGHRWGGRGGRVYTTAMAALSLEAPFRFLRVLSERAEPRRTS